MQGVEEAPAARAEVLVPRRAPSVTYSRRYKKTRDAAGNVIASQYIPRLTNETINRALKYLRGGTGASLTRSAAVRAFLSGSRSMSVEPDLSSREWSEQSPYFWYNILLGPYEWEIPRSGRSYAAPEDDLSDAGVDSASSIEFPRQESDDRILFGDNGFDFSVGVGTPEEKTMMFYVAPRGGEQEIVDYIRASRKHFDGLGDDFMFVLFHNLLVPYVFGEAAVGD